jgi:hypothetical protein
VQNPYSSRSARTWVCVRKSKPVLSLCKNKRLHLVLNSVRIASRQSVLGSAHDSYLVDPASSHMLVSKIKPCMSKYKQLIL